MQLIEVKNRSEELAFLDVARELYKNDPEWVCPLDTDIEAVFNPEKNTYYQHGEATRWILKNSSGKLIGRVAAFINEKKANYNNKRIGGIGFFESINDETASKMLLDAAIGWLKERKVTTVDGPINFGENDQYWGLLVEGFTQPSYGMAYNHPYYKQLLESYGFQKKMEQITNEFTLENGLSPRFVKIAEYVMQRRPNLEIREFKPTLIDGFAEDFMNIYNSAWAEFENFTPIKKEYVIETFRKIKPIVDPGLVQFAYVDGEPAAFVMCLPDVNQIFKKFNGKLNLWNKLRFVWLKKTKYITRVRVVVMGSKPKFQNMGLESVLTYCCFKHTITNTNVNEIELSWVGDFNEKMLAIHRGLGAKPSKKHITYRLELN
ncbi:hypothetical protein [Roseivirga sp. UBA838]|uniref:hypothetical protein n=1 Tax=Roseivirga sp. UBA838 TaxID=1947393 RepID=UPI00257C4553|nr:hypothetical protein [Roseivirga sp. UBA838]|tara:strand:+ start:80935 stop:82062 length:1128 start_codon:yes stop_codon:yes gene_type:complete